MLIEVLISILVGILLGTITGLTPGVHINLISALVLAFSVKLTTSIPALPIATGLIAMGITHTFLDILPTTFLGAADSENAISTLPSHKLLLQGRAKESILLALIGSFLGLIITILLSPLIIIIVTKTYPIISKYIAHILILISLAIIYNSKDKKLALIIFLFSGALGIIALNLKTLNQPLFPLLSGLFGISALILGIKNKIKIPKQKEDIKLNLPKFKVYKNLASSIIASILTSFLPGLTASHTTAVASVINKIEDDKDYILINNSINTISMFLSIIALYSINKARNGVIVALSNIMEITKNHIFFFSSVSLVVAFIAIFITLNLTKVFAKIAPKIDYQILCLIIISFILILVAFLSGPLGILVLVVSTLVGIVALLIDVERTHLMGVLILPVILFFML